MKIMAFTNDPELTKTLLTIKKKIESDVLVFDSIENNFEVVAKVCSKSPSILILDDDRFKPNSPQILTAIKNDCDSFYTIFVTSNNNPKEVQQVLEKGIDSFHQKPVIENEMYDTLISLINLASKDSH